MHTFLGAMTLLLRLVVWSLVAVPLLGMGYLAQTGAIPIAGLGGSSAVPWGTILLALAGWTWFLWPEPPASK